MIDEKGQRKAFDAQFQIATIVRTQLANPVKGIIEYRKVVTNWPESYVAATALHEIGNSYLALGETAKAREAFMAVAKDYPTSPLAGASLFQVGKSYEDEADKLATITRENGPWNWPRSRPRARPTSRCSSTGTSKKSGPERTHPNLKSSGKESGRSGRGQRRPSASTATTWPTRRSSPGRRRPTSRRSRPRNWPTARTRSTPPCGRRSRPTRPPRKIPGGNKADAALLQMANIYDQRLKDSKAAMETWLEIVRQFSGTAVAQDASWKLAQYYEKEGKYAQAIEAYNAFLRNYRGSPNAGAAQFAVAECYEHLGQWVAAMDSYNNYINNFPDGPLVAKAKEQIGWIKTYRL